MTVSRALRRAVVGALELYSLWVLFTYLLEGRQQTLAIYQNLSQLARSARDDAGKDFIAHDVGERAAAVRRVLNQLGPYYDPDFPPLAPHPNIEPGATR